MCPPIPQTPPQQEQQTPQTISLLTTPTQQHRPNRHRPNPRRHNRSLLPLRRLPRHLGSLHSLLRHPRRRSPTPRRHRSRRAEQQRLPDDDPRAEPDQLCSHHDRGDGYCHADCIGCGREWWEWWECDWERSGGCDDECRDGQCGAGVHGVGGCCCGGGRGGAVMMMIA